MKRYLTHLCLATAICLSPLATSPTFAQDKANAQVEAVQEMGAWMQDSLKIQTDMMSLFNTDMIQEMYAVLNNGDESEIARFGEKFEATRQVVLSRAKMQMEALAKPKRWNIDPRLFSKTESGLHRAALSQYDSMTETYEEYDKLSSSLSEMLTDFESLDENALLAFQKIQISSGIKMIEIENRQIDGFMAALEESNPNYQFQKIVKQINLASIPEMELSHVANDNLELRQDYARKMRDDLMPITYLIKRGRRNAAMQIKALDRLDKGNLSEADVILLPRLYDVYNSFDETFDIEMKIHEAMMSSADLYMSDQDDWAISDQIDENDLKFFALMEERAHLVNARMALIQ